MVDKKLSALIIITALAVAGMLIEPSKNAPSAARYIITDLGQFLIILSAASIGFERAKNFSFKSSIGRALALVSLGLLLWGIGAMIWLYYNIALKVEVPYPSVADAAFVGTIVLSSLGLFWLLKSINPSAAFDAKTALKSAALPAAVFVSTYWLFIQSKLAENTSALEKLLNVAYPFGDAIFLSFALAILGLTKGGKLSKPIGIICLGFIIQSLADFAFSWTTSNGTYYVGSPTDVLFSLAFFTIGVGMHYTGILYESKKTGV